MSFEDYCFFELSRYPTFERRMKSIVEEVLNLECSQQTFPSHVDEIIKNFTDEDINYREKMLILTEFGLSKAFSFYQRSYDIDEDEDGEIRDLDSKLVYNLIDRCISYPDLEDRLFPQEGR